MQDIHHFLISRPSNCAGEKFYLHIKSDRTGSGKVVSFETHSSLSVTSVQVPNISTLKRQVPSQAHWVKAMESRVDISSMYYKAFWIPPPLLSSSFLSSPPLNSLFRDLFIFISKWGKLELWDWINRCFLLSLLLTHREIYDSEIISDI